MKCNRIECCLLGEQVVDVWFAKAGAIEGCCQRDQILPMWDSAGRVAQDVFIFDQGKMAQ